MAGILLPTLFAVGFNSYFNSSIFMERSKWEKDIANSTSPFSINYYRFSEVSNNMLRLTYQLKVFYSIINSISILVVYDFFRKWFKRSTKMFLHYNSMFFNLLSVDINESITPLVYMPTSVWKTFSYKGASPFSVSIVMFSAIAKSYIGIITKSNSTMIHRCNTNIDVIPCKGLF